MFWMGALTGAANKVQENYAEREARLKEQMDEARAFAKVNEKRKSQATEAYSEISRLANNWGVDPSVVYDSWKSGYTPELKNLVDGLEKARGSKVSPEEIKELIVLGEDFSEDVDVSEALNKMYGVVTEYGSKENTSNSLGIFNTFARILGGDHDGAVQEMLDRRTVGGVNANALVNMGDPEGYTGTGGIRYDVVGRKLEETRGSGEQNRRMRPSEARDLAEITTRDIMANSSISYKEVTKNLLVDHVASVILQDGLSTPADVLERKDDYFRYDPNGNFLDLRVVSNAPMEERGWTRHNLNDLGAATVYIPPETTGGETEERELGAEALDTASVVETPEGNVFERVLFEEVEGKGGPYTGVFVSAKDGIATYKAFSPNGQDDLGWTIQVPTGEVLRVDEEESGATAEQALTPDPELEKVGENLSPATRALLDNGQSTETLVSTRDMYIEKRNQLNRQGNAGEAARIDKIVKVYEEVIKIRSRLEENG